MADRRSSSSTPRESTSAVGWLLAFVALFSPYQAYAGTERIVVSVRPGASLWPAPPTQPRHRATRRVLAGESWVALAWIEDTKLRSASGWTQIWNRRTRELGWVSRADVVLPWHIEDDASESASPRFKAEPGSPVAPDVGWLPPPRADGDAVSLLWSTLTAPLTLPLVLVAVFLGLPNAFAKIARGLLDLEMWKRLRERSTRSSEKTVYAVRPPRRRAA
jgi:hypothetical protein